MVTKKIRVLIVDDSLVFREVISMGISSEPHIEVVAKAVDPFEARNKILEFHPDVMICDVQMPKMNGIEFIRRLLPQYLLPIIVVSSINESLVDAMEAGAVDFVLKPDVQSTNSVKGFIGTLIEKINMCYGVNVVSGVKKKSVSFNISQRININKIIAIGASTGGTEAIYNILKTFPENMPGILIVQHIPPVFSKMFAERLNSQTKLQVREAQGGEYVETGKVLIAPGDKHMTIKKIGNKYKVQLFRGEKVNGHCPSVDMLFESVAKEASKNAIGIILTGMGYDGARGLRYMRRKGARTIGQDEKSSVVYGMPKVAYEIGAVEKQVSLDNIPEVLFGMLH